MITTLGSLNVGTRFLAGTVLAAAALLVLAMPYFAHAATYAYVNQSGDVNTVTADTGMTAIAVAPNIDEHSGVILIGSSSDSIVGDAVFVK